MSTPQPKRPSIRLFLAGVGFLTQLCLVLYVLILTEIASTDGYSIQYSHATILPILLIYVLSTCFISLGFGSLAKKGNLLSKLVQIFFALHLGFLIFPPILGNLRESTYETLLLISGLNLVLAWLCAGVWACTARPLLNGLTTVLAGGGTLVSVALILLFTLPFNNLTFEQVEHVIDNSPFLTALSWASTIMLMIALLGFILAFFRDIPSRWEASSQSAAQ